MKLVDILARELAEWPGSDVGEQDFCVQSNTTTQVFFGAPHGEIFLSERADETVEAKVSRAEWQAAVEALKAEQELEPVIDWSKQPKDYPLWLEGKSEDLREHSDWYCESGEVFTGEDGWLWGASREGQFFTVHRKPVNTPVAAEQAAELKWPDGAEFMGTTKEGSPKVFYRNVDGDYEYRYEHETYWSKSKGTPVHTPLIPRPTERAVEQGNNGLPPLGSTVRIVDLGRHVWDEAKRFIGSDCTLEAVFMTGDTQMVAVEHVRDEVCACFRADMVRTIEQAEHEERVSAAYAMCAIAPSLSNVDAVALYDAFYRKQVAE